MGLFVSKQAKTLSTKWNSWKLANFILDFNWLIDNGQTKPWIQGPRTPNKQTSFSINNNDSPKKVDLKNVWKALEPVPQKMAIISLPCWQTELIFENGEVCVCVFRLSSAYATRQPKVNVHADTLLAKPIQSISIHATYTPKRKRAPRHSQLTNWRTGHRTDMPAS